MKQPITSPPVAPWIRIALIALSVPSLLAGIWAVLSPEGWFDDFPGWDPRLVAAEPPFNEHLATDAGAGLLAAGVVLLAAAWFADIRSVRLGLIAHATFAVPHAAWHVLNPSPALTGAEDAQNSATLVFAVVATVVLYVAASRAGAPSSSEDTAQREEIPA